MFEQYKEFVAPIEIEGDPEQTRIFALLNRMLLMIIYLSGVFVFIGVWFLARYTAKRGYL